MIEVVLDTSIFRQDPKREKSAFRALKRLCWQNKVQLHIPEFVKREFLSQQEDLIAKDLDAIRSSANSLLRRTRRKELTRYATKVVRGAEEVCPKITAEVGEEFAKWMSESNAKGQRIKSEHTQQVINDYFEGNPPFKTRKNRSDIPDSFIWQAICDISERTREVHIVANDGALLQAVKSKPGLISYSTLEEFIESPVCQTAIRQLDQAITANIDRISKQIRKDESLAHMVEVDIINALSSRKVRGRDILDDNNEGMILTVGEPKNLKFDFEAIDYYGGGEFGIPFTTSIECSVSYAIAKGNFYTLPEWKADRISVGELNEHYLDAEEDFAIDVEGSLLVKMDLPDLDKAHLSDNDIAALVSDADHDVEIKKAEVHDDSGSAT